MEIKKLLMLTCSPRGHKESDTNERLIYTLSGSSDGKESASNSEDLGLVSGLGNPPGRREWQPILVFLPREFHGQKSLAGYSPWSHK